MSSTIYKQAKILIIDDQIANIRLLETILELAGYENIFSVIDPRQSLPLFQKIQPDLVLLDLAMPHMDGFTVMRQLQTEMVEDIVPILVLTADATLTARHKALKEGARDFLTKPLDETEVLLRIHNMLESRFYDLLLESKIKERTQEVEAARAQLYQLIEQANCLLWRAEVNELSEFCENDPEQIPFDPVRNTAVCWNLRVVNEGQTYSWLPFARKEKESLSNAWRRSWHCDDQPVIYRTANEALMSGRDRYTISFRNRMADDSIRWVYQDVRLVQCPPAEECTSMAQPLRRWQLTGVVTDVTEERRAQEMQQEVTEELMRSNAALQEFFFITSHDLQEPLRKIQALGTLLTRRFEDGLDPDAKNYLKRMSSAANRMQRLLLAIQEYAHVIGKDRQTSSVDLNAIATRVITEIKPMITEVNPLITIGPLPTLQADPSQIRQLFFHLITNALKFRRTDVRLDLRIMAESDAQGTNLYFIDNGIGFAPEYTDRIFKIFERLEDSGNGEECGIGLPICKKIVERHGGTITARANHDAGATFKVWLPKT